MTETPNAPAQLTLNIRLQDDATFDNFLVSENDNVALEAIKQQVNGNGEQILFLHGPGGSGRSHLLQAACHARGPGALYLPLGELLEHGPREVLEGIAEGQCYLSIDDVDLVAGQRAWEEALFHLINVARDSGCGLLFAAGGAPRGLSFLLPDLSSRLSWGGVFSLSPSDDEQRLAVLCFRARRRGLNLAPEAAHYLLTRAPRGMTELLELLDILDRRSLQHGRALTIAFVKDTLGW